jgi:hypothetical protein
VNEENASDIAVVTYGYLRAGIVVLVLFLGVAIGLDFILQHTVEESISSYYYTPVRVVFVGVLCAVGIGMIAYSSTLSVEDQLLNVAGVMAFFVATIPTRHALDPAAASDVTSAIRVGALAVVIAFLMALVANIIVRRQLFPQGRLARAVGVILVAGVVVFGYVVLFHVEDAQSLHPIAACTLFVAISLVAFINAVLASGPFRVWYVISAVGIVLSLVFVLLIHWRYPNFTQLVLVLEVLPILFFTLFWAVQTKEMLGRITRPAANIPDVLTR